MSNARLARLARLNRRDFFRLAVHTTDCVFTATAIGGRPPEEEAAARRTYEVLDLGGGGISFRSRHDDWPIRAGIVARVQFRVGDRDYDFKCRLVRKVDSMADFDYGGRWVDVPPSQIDDLIYTLYRMELARTASRPGPQGLQGGRTASGRRAAGARGGGRGAGRSGSRANGSSLADGSAGGTASHQGLGQPALWAAAGLTVGLSLLLLPDAPYRDPLAALLWMVSMVLCVTL